MRENTYENPPLKKDKGAPFDKAPSTNPSSSLSPSTIPFTIEKLILDMILPTPKSTIRKSMFNPSARPFEFYNIVEYLAQEPCTMSTLEVLQTCPT